eukprot:958121-Rhodomonas_salina.1
MCQEKETHAFAPLLHLDTPVRALTWGARPTRGRACSGSLSSLAMELFQLCRSLYPGSEALLSMRWHLASRPVALAPHMRWALLWRRKLPVQGTSSKELPRPQPPRRCPPPSGSSSSSSLSSSSSRIGSTKQKLSWRVVIALRFQGAGAGTDGI